MSLRVILSFFDHVNWTDEKIEQNLKKVVEYLEKHNIEFAEDMLELDKTSIEISKADFLEFCSFIIEELEASPNCIHIPYQILCVNGEGNFELIESFPAGMNIDDFVQYMWQKRVEFPKIEF